VSWKAIAADLLHAKSTNGAAPSPSPSTRKPDATRVKLRPEDVLNREAMKPKGQWHDATVPDTLDLAESAKLAINVQTNSMDAELVRARWKSCLARLD